MKDLNMIIDYLKSNISSERFMHSVNVAETAARLAEFHGCDTVKAHVAGLVHDCARELDKGKLISCLEAEGIIPDPLTMSLKELLHGPAGVHICRTVFDICDGEILSAVRYHTTGKENMSLLEKVIYLSDFIEPSRCFDGVEKLREQAYVDLDEAVLMALNSSIRYIISKNGLIHIDTILSRNYLLKETSKA